MRALTWHGKHDVRMETVDDPGIVNPRDCVIKVTSTAICGSDLHLYDGFIPEVRKGDVLATVTPPVQAVDVSDMRQRQGELDQQIVIMERRVERYRKLAPGGAVSQVQLDDAQARAQVPAGDADRADGFGPQFVGQLVQFPVAQRLQVRGQLDPVKDRRLGQVGHRLALCAGRGRAVKCRVR